MPIYEFVCGECGRKFRKLVGVVAQSSDPACPRCQSTVLNRQISRFARVRSEDDTLNSLADEMETLGDSDDPKTMRRMMRDMTAAMGEDMDGDMEQMLEEGNDSPAEDSAED
jgi:putative FmdB family regulatory protein